ncbi:MAG: translocation protein TolB [Bdellovibrionota bacterium]
MKAILAAIAVSLLSPAMSARADSPLVSVEVGQARVKKTLAAFPEIQAGTGAEAKLKALRETTMTDLDFSGLFDFLAPAAFLEKTKDAGIAPNTFKMTDWSTIGAELLIKAKGSMDGKALSLEVFAYAVVGGKQLLAKKYRATDESLRMMAHSVANDILFALTGKKGPFTSKLAFVSDHSGTKQIYVSDYDGFNPIRITTRFPQATAPAWSPDGKKLVFSAVTKNAKNVRNRNLFLYDFSTRRFTMLSDRQGINSGAVFSPNGKQLALTLSFSGNAEIYSMDPEDKTVQRLTNGYGLKVDPAWSPDGKQITYVSDSPGKSMIYKMDSNGANPQRLTFAGDFNATPSWSPAGDKIAFAGSDAGKFDLFIMNPDGSNIERLTKNMGDNEDPDFAPDGYFIAYSSNRGGKRNIYITNVDNTVHREVTSGFGNCEAPRWSPAN